MMSRVISEHINAGNSYQCPTCEADIPMHQHYSPWCDVCEWNLQPAPATAAASENTGNTGFLRHLLDYSDEYVFKDVIDARDKFEGITFPQVASLTLSSLIYLVELLLIFQSALIIIGTYHPALKLLAIIVAAIAVWALIPRFDVKPDVQVLTDSEEFPAINQAVARISKELGVDMPDLLLTEQFTATFGRIAPRRRPVLALGHPFLSVLTKEEMVGLLAHEISHSFDGSLARSVMVRQAIEILRRWQRVLAPGWYVKNRLPAWQLNALLLPTYLFLPLSLSIRKLGKLMHLFCMRDCQRAEYVADARSIRVAGNTHTLSLLRKSYYRYLGALLKTYERSPSQRKFDSIQKQLASIPEREIDRIWRIALREPARINSTHPRLSFRIAFLESMEKVQPKITLSQSEFAAIQSELEAWPCIIRRREADWKEEQESDSTQQFDKNCLSLSAD